jgi:hypothetical protein
MELLVTGFYLDDPRETWTFVNVDEDKLIETYPREDDFQKKYPFAAFEYIPYTRIAIDGGINTVTIMTDGLTNMMTILKDPGVLDAARSLNWQALCQGRNSYARFHCFDLADLLV